MARHAHPRRKADLTERYDTDVCFLPRLAAYATIIVHPLKTIYTNMDAAPWAHETKEIHRFDDELLEQIGGRAW